MAERDQVESALRNLGFRPAQVRAGLAALAPGDTRPVSDLIKDALRHVDDPPAAVPSAKVSAPAEAPAARSARERPALAAALGSSSSTPKPSKKMKKPDDEPTKPPKLKHLKKEAKKLARKEAKVAARAAEVRAAIHQDPATRQAARRLRNMGIGAAVVAAGIFIIGRATASTSPTASPAPGPSPTPAPSIPPVATPAQSGRTVKVIVKTRGLSANLRAAPASGARVVAGIPSGSDATILETRGQWARVSVAGREGWMDRSLLPGAA